MSYFRMADATLSSALNGFTSEFEMGSGGSRSLSSPDRKLVLMPPHIRCQGPAKANVFLSFFFLLIFFLTFFSNSSEKACVFFVSLHCLLINPCFLYVVLCTSYFKTTWVLYDQASRSISTAQLSALLHVHSQPINVVVFNEPLGDLKSREISSQGGFPA